MNNWQTKKIGEIAKIQAGYGFPKNIQGKLFGDFPFIKVGDMNYQKQEVYLGISENYLDQKDLKENGYRTMPAGTIIFPKIGGAIATNKKRILAVDSLYDNNVMGIIPGNVVLSEYLYYWLNTKNLSDWASGTSLPAINKSTIEVEEILLPPLEMQKKIVVKLDEKFAKLREAKKLREEALADTEKIPFQTLREIFEEGKQKGWEEKSIDEITEVVTKGTTPKTLGRSFADSGVPFLKAENIAGGPVDLLLLRTFISDETNNLLNRSKTKSGDVLMTIAGTIGRVGYLPENSPEMNTNQAVAIIRPKKDLISSVYLTYALQSPFIQKGIWNGVVKAAIPNFSLTRIKEISIPLPTLNEQQKIVTKLDKLSQKIQTLREFQISQLADLKRLEKAYLREAFRGEL